MSRTQKTVCFMNVMSLSVSCMVKAALMAPPDVAGKHSLLCSFPVVSSFFFACSLWLSWGACVIHYR
jgi:hypothetical protein